jgi:hypothetical protein
MKEHKSKSNVKNDQINMIEFSQKCNNLSSFIFQLELGILN